MSASLVFLSALPTGTIKPRTSSPLLRAGAHRLASTAPAGRLEGTAHERLCAAHEPTAAGEDVPRPPVLAEHDEVGVGAERDPSLALQAQHARDARREGRQRGGEIEPRSRSARRVWASIPGAPDAQAAQLPSSSKTGMQPPPSELQVIRVEPRSWESQLAMALAASMARSPGHLDRRETR
jgi:hypothetical protein